MLERASRLPRSLTSAGESSVIAFMNPMKRLRRLLKVRMWFVFALGCFAIVGGLRIPDDSDLGFNAVEAGGLAMVIVSGWVIHLVSDASRHQGP